MEQYGLPSKMNFQNLKMCLDNYRAEHLFIRLKGSSGGTVKVSENLEGKVLDFKKTKSELTFLIDSKEVFCFSLKDYYKYGPHMVYIAYERYNIADGRERIMFLEGITDPYDSSLPEPKTSVLRTVIDNHLLEIAFKGRVNLEFHSWWDKPHWKYWKIVK